MSNEEYVLAYQQGDRAALRPLWMQVEKLAVRMVKPYLGLARRNRAVDYDDLMQAAFLGVERAASAYKPDGGCFTTVMGFYVKNAVRGLLGLHGRVRREHYEAISTSTPLGDEGTATIGDTLADDSLPDQDGDMFRDDIAREVRAAIGRLEMTQAQVIRGYHLEGVKLAALAGELGVSKEKVQQIKYKAHRKLAMDKRLQELIDGGDCYRHKSLAVFRRDWTSATEAAVLWSEQSGKIAAFAGRN